MQQVTRNLKKNNYHGFTNCLEPPCYNCIVTTDIEERYQTSYTPQCNGFISHGAQFGGLWAFANHTRTAQHLCVFCLHAHTAVHAGNTHFTNHDYFDYGKNPKTLN